jgi:hypothetical protein
MSTFYCDPPYMHPHATEVARDRCNAHRRAVSLCQCGAMTGIEAGEPTTEQHVQTLDNHEEADT